jgi:hypothetical protein
VLVHPLIVTANPRATDRRTTGNNETREERR